MTKITIQSSTRAGAELVWDCLTNPQHIMQWNFATPDWHCPKASGDLRVGGAFSATMAAKDGSFSFDFGGIYDVVEAPHKLGYVMGDGRRVDGEITSDNGQTTITQTFDAETQNDPEMQRAGWQSILDNFTRYTDALAAQG